MREQFENLPEIAGSLSQHIYFGDDNLYHSDLINFQKLACWMNGAWYAYQEQQKKINEHNAKLQKFIDELTKTEQDDKDNKIEFWRGFAECAGSVRDVFLRDVGELK